LERGRGGAALDLTRTRWPEDSRRGGARPVGSRRRRRVRLEVGGEASWAGWLGGPSWPKSYKAIADSHDHAFAKGKRKKDVRQW
jgi:hypothetical protein